jgi:nitroimidazol reductase NimA-like FMN-containing flavoprotein (pyridoxamine 5'-phosphate oxidase superfamily)
MSLAMSREEREAFLVDLHVGVISIESADGPPLTVPIWYDYEPDRGVRIITGRDSLKGRALAKAGRFTLCAQTEDPGRYRYVSVSGAVVSVQPADKEGDSRPMARRYLGVESGDLYTEGSSGGDNLTFLMQPDVWRTVDYGKLGETPAT